MKDTDTIMKALKVFPGETAILYSADTKETVTFQDVVDYIKEQNAEIERLTEKLEVKKKECREIADDYQEMGTFYYNETVKTAELQKQVDELTEERENMQAEIMRFEDMKFTQEHCNLYEENEWLKEILRQYMNGEMVNENVFCQSVEEMGEALKYRTKEIYEEAKRLYDNDSNYEGWFSDSSFGRQFKYFIESKGVEVE